MIYKLCDWKIIVHRVFYVRVSVLWSWKEARVQYLSDTSVSVLYFVYSRVFYFKNRISIILK